MTVLQFPHDFLYQLLGLAASRYALIQIVNLRDSLGFHNASAFFTSLYFRHPSPHFPLSFSWYLPPLSAFHSIYRTVLPSCGYSTQLCSRQTIWCTLLMTDPTWPRHHLAATARCVCLLLCAWGQVHGDWWWDAVCKLYHQAGGLRGTLKIILTLFHLLSGYCRVNLHPHSSWISTVNWLLENNEQDLISGEREWWKKKGIKIIW